MSDLRTVIRDRMVEVGLDQRGLARLMAEPWGIKWQSAEQRISEWLNDGRDMTTKPFAALLDVLGLAVGVFAAEQTSADAERETGNDS